MYITIPNISFQSLMLIPYFILIIAGLMVPSDGGHGLLNIKSLAFLATVLAVSLHITYSPKFNLSQYKILCFLLCSMSFLLLWMLIGFFYGETPSSSSWDQFKICWLTISVVAISLYLVMEELISFQTLLKTIIYANFTYSFLKIALVFFHLLGFINMWSVIQTLGIRFISMGILGNMPRLQTSIDIATPFLLFFFLQGKQLGITWNRLFRFVYLTISVMAIFLSFSRFLIAVAALSCLLHGLTLRFSTLMRSFAVFLAILSIGIGFIGIDNVYLIVERRFFSTNNAESDNTRVNQIDALVDEHQQYPILGKGLGSYAQNNIRDRVNLYSYEVQWVAFLMQLGMIGISFILLPVGVIASKILSKPLSRPKIALFILFLSWLFSGFTNPFLVSLTSGILYTLFLLSGLALNLHTRESHD